MSTWLEEEPTFVAFGIPLSSGYAEGEHGGRLNGIVDGLQGGVDSVKFTCLVEPLVTTENPLVDCDGEPEIWPPQ